jgi:hypothetical protein
MMTSVQEELGGRELWRRQCARNLMDCYAVTMEVLMDVPGDRDFEALARLMVDGMTSVLDREDEKVFYRLAAGLCQACGRASHGKAPLFRIFASLFADMPYREG